jgi:hypothetical protein
MPYLPTDWKDRAVDKPMTYIMQDNGDGTMTLIPAEGNIAETGTPLTAANLNHMEAGISAALRKDETGDMQGNLITNVRIELPVNLYASAGGGLNVNNADIMGLNNLFFNDSVTGRTEGIQWAKSTTPVGSIDVNEYDNLRVYNGQLFINDKPIASDGAGALWTGGAFLSATQTITPTRPLSKCANGWALVWSDYDVGGSPNNFDYVVTLIPKNAAQYSATHQAIMASYVTATQVVYNAKTFTYTDTAITGNAVNESQNAGNNNADVVLRMAVEF